MTKAKSKFWTHQNQSLKVYARENRVFDISDPGTGKTAVAVEQFRLRRAKRGKCALVMCPKTLIGPAWINEVMRVAPELTAVPCLAEKNRSGFDLDADIYVTNIDAAKWLADQPSSFFKQFDTLIIDEHSAFKHRTSQRSKAMAKIVKHFEYRAGLTGTPNPISVLELWHQVYLLDDGYHLGNNFWRFRNEVTYPEQIGPRPEHVKWVDKPEAALAVSSLLQDMTIRHEFEKCIDIPPNRLVYVPYELPPKLHKAYQQLADEAVLILERGDVTAVHAAALREKLLQVASGAVYTHDDKWEVIDRGRYELAAQLVSERRHSVVFFLWKHQRQELVRECEKQGITHEVIDGATPSSRRDAIVKDYQAGNLQTVLLHPRTGAHGLTLTRGTATIWVSPVGQADVFKQGNHRIYRGGQQHKTETICIQAPKTVERLVYERREGRTDTMKEFLEMLRT